MIRNKTLLNKRNSEIKKAFKKLKANKIKGYTGEAVSKYSHRGMLTILSNKFFISPETIQDIINN
jgi:hypothetical protein